VEKELSRGDKVTLAWVKVVGILFDLRDAWEEFLIAQKRTSKVELEQLPRVMNKHIGHLFMRASFEKAMPILVQYWGVRGGLNFLKIEDKDIPGFEKPVEIKLDKEIKTLTLAEAKQKKLEDDWAEFEAKGGI
jgi:hypothetical protein